MSLDSTGLRKIKRGVKVVHGPFQGVVAKVAMGQAFVQWDGMVGLGKAYACNHLTVYDEALQPSEHDQPRMEDDQTN